MEPELVKTDTLGAVDGGFVEANRWKVLLEGRHIGDVWRGKRAAKGCWFVVPACHGVSLHQSYVGGGYAATTKKGAVEDLLNWHGNVGLFRTMSSVALHVFVVKETDAERQSDILAIFPGGRAVWIDTLHRKLPRPRSGPQAEPGWYAAGRRGNRFIGADNCASEDEAIALLMPEIIRDADREDKVAIPPQTRIKGSLSFDIGAAA